MSRTTIDFGIDLGTTNSAIAMLSGVGAEIIKNNLGSDTTPSAVTVDPKGRVRVGMPAKQRSEKDPANTGVEFKGRMGASKEPMVFPADGRSMTPEQLSAEVLRSLRQDVQQKHGEEIGAAVITVPAAFDLSACDATRRAAELAGLPYAPLLQEPTAAASAYGFQTDTDNAFWLVYDIGGGTFDAAVINVRDGEFTVVDHSGDNYLGGKLLDWAIVEEVLIPAAAGEFRFDDLHRRNPKQLQNIAKLKAAAEAAKIELSRAEEASITIDLVDAAGRPQDFIFDLARADVERLMEPLIVRSVNLTRKALADSHLGPGDIERVLLVGGPTLMPYLRERLADPREGFGIPLDYSQDPLTVVARGAAIFAGGQRLDTVAAPPPPAASGRYAVELEYRPVGPDVEPLVGGRVTGDDVEGCAIQFVNPGTKPEWRSGGIPLSADGTFTATLWAEKGRANVFRIELTNATGDLRPITPDTLTYTVGIVETQPPLTHSIGIGLADNEVEWLLRKGTPLPARRRSDLSTTVTVSRGSGEGMIRIPVVEGEHHRADRNHRIGRLEIDAEQVTRDVPEGSSVELTLTVDESRLVVARGYVPILDEEFEQVLNLETESAPDAADLARDAAAEKRRLASVRRRADEYGDARAAAVLARIDAERTVADLDTQVNAAAVDQDAAITGGKRLLDLRAAVDEAEDELEWPELVQQAHDAVEMVREITRELAKPADRPMLQGAVNAIQEAITAHDAGLLRQRVDEAFRLSARVLDESGELPHIIFRQLQPREPDMRDRDEAARLFATGRRAADSGDLDTLRQVNAALNAMLPSPVSPLGSSTVVRGR